MNIYFLRPDFSTKQGVKYWQDSIEGYKNEILIRENIQANIIIDTGEIKTEISDNFDHMIGAFCLRGLLDLYQHQHAVVKYSESECYIRLDIEDDLIYISGNDLWDEENEDELVEAYVDLVPFLQAMYQCGNDYLRYLNEIKDFLGKDSQKNEKVFENLENMIWRIKKLLKEVNLANIPALQDIKR
ncbi:hypothetical protein [uncultured Microscilla sp.]|uniref:hypothetical protein n=1 Tax=uncultured Microscilla sp. TaxID=432653 RepID=UPI0026146D91|nr:hypothetical protein [uncultured Microscilla sp.]